MSLVSPRIAVVVGARPNFIKIAPVLRAASAAAAFEVLVVHTGQHFSPGLSEVFFKQLGLRSPDVHLGDGGGTHAEQTARVMVAIERLLLDRPDPIDALMVVGDVDSTLAAAIAAAKLNVPLIHLEAGLRSFDRAMPEEINRLATDAISDLLLVSEPAGEENLHREGVAASRIAYIGNVMIDSLVHHLREAEALPPPLAGPFALVTIHRPSNVDTCESLASIVDFLRHLSSRLPLVLPLHPRTESRLRDFGLWDRIADVHTILLLPPQGYIENLAALLRATIVLTDSGGIQEEAAYLGVPCLTLRSNTERPVTITSGTNELVGLDFTLAGAHVDTVLAGKWKKSRPIPGWDGRAAERAVAAVQAFLQTAACTVIA